MVLDLSRRDVRDHLFRVIGDILHRFNIRISVCLPLISFVVCFQCECGVPEVGHESAADRGVLAGGGESGGLRGLHLAGRDKAPLRARSVRAAASDSQHLSAHPAGELRIGG